MITGTHVIVIVMGGTGMSGTSMSGTSTHVIVMGMSGTSTHGTGTHVIVKCYKLFFISFFNFFKLKEFNQIQIFFTNFHEEIKPEPLS